MKTKRIGMTAVFLLAAAFLFFGAGQQESAKQLFEKALHLEETKGDLEKAVEVYKRIVAEFPEERILAAQSFYHLGLCYEKLGLRDARKAFENVIEAYPDQTAMVRLAREKLAALDRAQAPVEKRDQEFKITKIHAVESTRGGYLSPNGKKLALIDFIKYDLWLRDIASGKEARILSTPSQIVDCSWSPDSQWIAYIDATNSVSIISSQGGQPRTIIEADLEAQKGGDYVYPTGWTSDSAKLIFQTAEGLFVIPASGGKWEEIYKFPDPQEAKERDEWLTISPDGRFIAYQSTQVGNTDIYVMPARGGEPVRITDDPAGDSWPKWSHDGQWLAFRSARTGTAETWVIRITPDGKPGSQPVQATRGAGGVGGGGVWTQDGKIAYSTRKEICHLFAANSDGSGEIQLTKHNNWNLVPRWSPDGKNIAFDADYGVDGRGAVWTVPSSGGEEKFLALGGSPAWSPDGKKIAFSAETGRPRVKAKISIIPAEGGEAKELMNYDGALTNLDWSPDGQSIAFSYSRGKAGKNPIPDSRMDIEDIYTIPVNGGKPNRLTQIDKKGFWFTSPRWSPDGKKIAFRSFDSEGWEKGHQGELIGIYTIEIGGGEPKLVTNDFDHWYFCWFCWSPDSKNIIFPKQEKDSPGPYGADRRLYKIAAEGGKPENLNIIGTMPDLSPDGKKIVFSRITGSSVEFWLVENFLPTDKKGK